MKILYGVQTTGNGHISRSRELIGEIKKLESKEYPKGGLRRVYSHGEMCGRLRDFSAEQKEEDQYLIDCSREKLSFLEDLGK